MYYNRRRVAVRRRIHRVVVTLHLRRVLSIAVVIINEGTNTKLRMISRETWDFSW